MGRGKGFSREFKQAAVKKFLTRGSRKVEEIAREVGVSTPTLYEWKEECDIDGGMKKQSKPQDRSANEKLKALIEYDALPAEKRGEYLRQNGLHEEHINEWRKYIDDALSSSQKPSRSADQKRIKELEKELRRKDKALAEASALLILKKKADLIWGTVEDE